MGMEEVEPIMLSALQHWSYCPRQCALTHVEQVFWVAPVLRDGRGLKQVIRLAALNAERLARRYARRHGVDYDTALARYGEMPNKCIPLPFFRQKSLSSEQAFCLWIKKTMATEPAGSAYSSYGLSAIATVPEF